MRITTQEYLREILHYDESSGVFTWNNVKSLKVKKGQIAGSVSSDGYVHIYHKNSRYKAHRLAWLYIHNELPNGVIDHINHIKTDNRIDNLRVVTPGDNSRNQPYYPREGAKYFGLRWSDKYAVWYAEIKHNNKTIYLGQFTNFLDAVSARKSAENKFNYHPNHGENFITLGGYNQNQHNATGDKDAA